MVISPPYSSWYRLRKQSSLFIFPLISLSIIFLDWNHTREWKNRGRTSSLHEQLLAAKRES